MKRAKHTQRGRTISPSATTPASGETGTVSITVPVLPPRNPYPVLARQRKAGAHDVDGRKRRRLEKSELRRRLVEG